MGDEYDEIRKFFETATLEQQQALMLFLIFELAEKFKEDNENEH